MSVPADKRTESKLKVIMLAKDLAAYTLKITSNSKVFLPEYNDNLTKHIVEAALNIYLDAWNANDIKVDGSRKRADERLQLQENSIRSCKDLLSLISLAKSVFHLRSKREEYWCRKTIEVRDKLRKWHESDIERYKDCDA